MKVWRFEWASLELALTAGVLALVALAYVAFGWIGQ